MRRVMRVLEKRTQELAQIPFFKFLRDTSIEPQQRLAMAPCVAHFVMTFADLYVLLREDPPRDKLQELVNAHTREDGDHWQWFLKDLDKLGLDPQLPFSDALRFIFSKDLFKQRLMSYRMFHLGLGADSLRKLVLVQCIEATGKVSLEHVCEVGRQFQEATGKRLVYLGPHHFDSEADHTLEEDSVHQMLETIELSSERVQEFTALVNECFDLFTDFHAELHRFIQEKQPFAAERSGKR